MTIPDVLVTFDPQFHRGLAETLQMRQDLETLAFSGLDWKSRHREQRKLATPPTYPGICTGYLCHEI